MPTMHVAVHTISFRGTAGAIFVLLCCSLVMFILGFATVSWSSKGNYREGLWESCNCSPQKGREDWFKAVQAMECIGLIALAISFLLIALYMCVHTVSKNSTIIGLVWCCFLAVLFMTIGFIIYGVEVGKTSRDLSWSFAVSVVACVLCLIAGIVTIIQLRTAGVQM